MRNEVRCVILNACYSAAQAKGISQHIDFVIGMTHAVADDAAIRFSEAFYRGIATGRSVQEAFDLGRISTRIPDEEQGSILRLLANKAEAAATYLDPEPELVCEFRLTSGGRPKVSEDDRDCFELRAFIRNPLPDTTIVYYLLDTDYHGHDRLSESDFNQPNFELIFDCPFDFVLRATFWSKSVACGGLTVRISEALRRRYAGNEDPAIPRTIHKLVEKSI